jgi:hypothetical protein
LRFLMLIGIFAGLAMPANAVEKATVAQVEQILAEHANKLAAVAPQPRSTDEAPLLNDAGLPSGVDDSVISRLAEIELTERMSTLTLYRLVGEYKLGARAQLILQQMADRSALLKLPADEEIPHAAPDAEAQSAMFNAARDYVFGKLSHLPDFLATRTTTSFDNTPSPLMSLQSGAENAGFRRREIVQRQISFRNGKEVLESASGAETSKPDDAAFESRGEFGTQASVVLMDIDQSSVSFDHWENTMGGVAAVYRYAVPRQRSHYEVTDHCDEHASFHDFPGYHGLIALASPNGTILRITLEVESSQSDPISHVASVIEYGPVVIGNRRSICPLRSLAFMVQEAKGCSQTSHKLQKPISMVNQTIFSNYHRFGSSSTMVFDEADSADPIAGVSPEQSVPRGHSIPLANPGTGTEPKQP